VEREGEDYGYAAFTSTIDTIIVGRKTYDWVAKEIGTAHYDNGERDVYVITRTERPATGRVKFYTGNLAELVRQLKNEQGKNIYCDGGAEIINELLKTDLVDAYTISLIPVLLGSGVRLFKDGRPEQLLQFSNSQVYDTGLVQLHYTRQASNAQPLDNGPFYHGTKASLQVGDLLTPGFRSNYKPEIIMNHIYFTALPDPAGLAAALAQGEGPERVYIVEPTGSFEDDPNVTDKKYKGNPTRSYRSQAPLKIVGEVTEWSKLAPEQVQEWREKIANIKGDIIN
jgi:dihydrofolate reductase